MKPFKPVKGYWFTIHTVRELAGSKCTETTLDIGLTTIRVCSENNKIRVKDFEVDVRDLEPSEPDRIVLLEETGRIYEVILHSDTGFYKLKAVDGWSPPTLEINGIHMHRIQGVNPWQDTLLKIKAARIRRGSIVLDTCMGLGYTAIASLKTGAVEVHTYEIDENVIWIAERNPWSRSLENDRIVVRKGDVVEEVGKLESEFFTRIIHDPPRFTKSTGGLYSLEFYRELYRVLKPGGVLFHYTGEPRRHGAPDILKGIKNRLLSAGFTRVIYDPLAQGFTCFKQA
ncbi:MAG: 50S ribosomal protein L11 methyltransferase [Desulfurococcus sp.]|nr:50S ribosomal protein L11 methyltransferase [Desulfurococcus sp.]